MDEPGQLFNLRLIEHDICFT